MELRFRRKILGSPVVGCSGKSRELPHARQIHLIVRWDVWEPVGAKTIDDDSLFEVGCSVSWVEVVSDTLLPSGHGAHLLYWGDVLEFTVESSVSELGIWQF